MNTGSILAGRPSLGAWVSYGLGTENENLPAFVVMQDNPGQVVNGPRNWGAGFMPAVYQGTPLDGGEEPIQHLANPKDVSDERQRAKLDLLAELNRQHAAERPEQIGARSPHRQLRAGLPHAGRGARSGRSGRRKPPRRRRSTAWTRRRPPASAGMCLLARRLVERGVRFVQLYPGSGSKWDAHSGHREEPLRQLPLRRSARRRPAEGPQAPRPARTTRSSSGAASSAARR